MSPAPNSTPRRSILAAAIWTAPVVAVAVAAPAASASPPRRVDLASTARYPQEASNGTHLGEPYFRGPRVLTYRASYRNDGPDALPAGGVIQFGLPFAGIWDLASFTIIQDSSGRNPVFTGTSTVEITTAGGPTAFRQLWNFTLPTALAAGTTFDLVFRVNLTATSTAATNYYRVRSYTNIGVGSTGAIETNSANNPGYSPYGYYNNANAG